MAQTDFWGSVNAQLDMIETKKPDTFEAVAAILEPIYDQGAIYGMAPDPEPWIDSLGTRWTVRPPEGWTSEYKPRRAFFAGSGGDRSLRGALGAAGWQITWRESSYYYVMRHPVTGAELTYIEGDVLPGDAR